MTESQSFNMPRFGALSCANRINKPNFDLLNKNAAMQNPLFTGFQAPIADFTMPQKGLLENNIFG